MADTPSISTSFIDLAGVARLEEARQSRGLSEVADAFEPIAGGIVARGGVRGGGSWLNNAAGLGLSGPVTGSDVDRLIAFHESHGAEPRVEVCPYADDSLPRLLGDAGFRIGNGAGFGGFETVLYRGLNADPPVRPIHPPPPGLRVFAIDPADAAAARVYAHISMSGFFPPGWAPREDELEIALRTLRHPRSVGVAAELDGEIVGAGAMEVAGEVCALFGLSVLPEFRRRGVQGALIAERLNLAARKGARLATIGSRPGVATERNVRRMGFSAAYSKVIMTRPGEGLVGVIG